MITSGVYCHNMIVGYVLIIEYIACMYMLILKFYRMKDVKVLDYFLDDHLRAQMSLWLDLVKSMNMFSIFGLVKDIIFD